MSPGLAVGPTTLPPETREEGEMSLCTLCEEKGFECFTEGYVKELEERISALEQENAALKSELDGIDTTTVPSGKYLKLVVDYDALRRQMVETESYQQACLRAKLKRAEKALHGIPHDHFIEDKPVGICCGCIADRYFEESNAKA